MEENRHKIATQIEHKIDRETGEILESTRIVTFTPEAEPEFIKFYLKDIERLNELPRGTSNILYLILRYMNYENQIVISKYQREEIARKLNLKQNTIDHTITALIKGGIISKIANCTYIANPDLFGKGKWSQVKKLRLAIEYNPDGRTFKFDREDYEKNE